MVLPDATVGREALDLVWTFNMSSKASSITNSMTDEIIPVVVFVRWDEEPYSNGMEAFADKHDPESIGIYLPRPRTDIKSCCVERSSKEHMVDDGGSIAPSFL